MSVAVVAVVAIDALYVALVYNQSDRPPDVYTPIFVAGYLALMVVALVVSLIAGLRIPWLRPALRGAATGGLVVMGVLAAFSVGLPILIAGMLVLASTVLELVNRWGVVRLVTAVVAAVLAGGLLLWGLDATSTILVCPSSGEMGGTTSGVLGHSITYLCTDGRLTTSS